MSSDLNPLTYYKNTLKLNFLKGQTELGGKKVPGKPK